MTKISNQYSLTNILTADLANSRLGINNVSPTVALDVTGAGKFSGALTGTTATFSGLVSLGGATATNPLNIRTANGESYIRFLNADGSTYGDFERSITGSGAIRFTGAYFRFANQLEVTGAATFSSSVQIGSTLSNSLSVGLAAPTTDTLNQIFAGQAAFGGQAAGGETDIGNNWYYYSGWKYRITAPSSNIKLNGDVISFERAASGTANAAITFSESMRILSGGALCIGMTTSPYSRLSVKSNGTSKYLGFAVYAQGNENFTFVNHDGNIGYIGCDSTAAGFLTPLAFVTVDAVRMTIATNGNIGAPTGSNIYNASDVRLKKNISTTTYGLDTISALNPVKFNWVDGFEPSEDGKDMLGFVAQEVQAVLPEAIESFGANSITIGDTIIDNPLRVNEKFIIPVLVKAIQELSAKVSLLENK